MYVNRNCHRDLEVTTYATTIPPGAGSGATGGEDMTENAWCRCVAESRRVDRQLFTCEGFYSGVATYLTGVRESCLGSLEL